MAETAKGRVETCDAGSRGSASLPRRQVDSALSITALSSQDRLRKAEDENDDEDEND